MACRALSVHAQTHRTRHNTQLCDRGTLRDAIRGGLFHARLPGGAIGVDLAAVVEVLLDVAYAVQYLHAMGLVHGDIKVGLPTV